MLDKNPYRQIGLFLLLLLPIVLAIWLTKTDTDGIIVRNGIADFRGGIDPEKYYPLRGEWQLFRNPADAFNSAYRTDDYIEVPGSWTNPRVDRPALPAFATVAYKATLYLPPNSPQHLAIVTDLVRSASMVYVNGRLQGGQGFISNDPAKFIAYNKPRSYGFEASERVELVIIVGNQFIGDSGGIITPIGFGSQLAVEQDRRLSVLEDSSIFAAFFMALLMFVGMYFQRVYQRELLYFSLYCLCSAFPFALRDERIALDIFPKLSFALGYRIDFVLSIASFMFITLYATAVLQRKFRGAPRKIVYLCLLAMGFCVIAPIPVLSQLLSWMLALNVLFVAIYVWYIHKAVRNREEGYHYLLFGLICYCVLLGLIYCNSNGIIDDVKAMAVEVPLFVVSQLLFIGERHRKNFTKQRLELAELAYLRAQVNPHFIYNMLGTISCLVEDEPRSAQDALVDFSSYLRKLLKPEELGTDSTVRQELELAEYYLRLEKLRFGERLEVRVDIEEAALNCRLPQLTLQPLVENAVKYGLLASHSGGAVTIIGRMRPDGRAQLQVSDSGRGISEQKIEEILSGNSSGIGVQNTRERILRYGGEFDITSTSATGTTMTIITSLSK